MATGLKGLNTKEGNDREMQRMGDSRPSFADYQRFYNLSTPVRREVGAHTPEDFGASVYDNEVKSFQDLDNLGDVRAENQPWFLKIANGIGKAGVLMGTTFADGTAGLVVGLGTAIQEGRFSGLWDNDFSRAMQSINDWSEEVMPNYYSKAEQESPWYENIFTANFWGDKFIKNLGFAVGALYTGKVVGAPLGKLVANLAKSRGAAQMAASATGAVVSAVNEGRVEALNNTRDWFNLQKEKLTSRMAERLDAKGIGYSINDNGDLIIDQSSSGGVQEASIYNSTLEKLTEDRLKMGNMDLLMNLPILTFSNIVQFGRFYSKGFDTGRKISNSLIKGSKGAALAVTKGALAEGTEEISQKAASVVSGKYYESDVDSYFKSRIDPNAEKEAIGFIQANMEGIAETLGDPNSWEEFTIGALTGILGVPTFRSARTEEGKWRSPIALKGGAVQHWKDHMSKVKRAEEIDAYINNRIQSPEYLNYYQGLISHIKRDNEKEDFLRSGDKFNYLNAEHRQLVEDIIMFDNAGRLEELKDMINSAFDTSDENLHSIVKNTTKEINGKLTGPFAEFAVKNPDGTVGASLDNGGREAITESLRDKADRIKTEIKNYRKVKDKLDESTNGVFTDSQLGELAWMQSHIDNWESRLGSMGTVLRDTLLDIRSKIEDKRNLADREREEFLMGEGASQKEIEDSVKRFSNYENYIKSIDTILSVPRERLGNMLSNNKQFTESLVANTLVLGSDIISGLDKNNVLTLLDDVIRIGDAQAIYREKLEEYLNNPESLTASNDRAREEVSDNIRAEEIRTLEEQLENTQSIAEIRNIAEGSNKDNIDAAIQKWQDGTDDTLKRKAVNYKETAQYDSELKKALNELGETDQVSQDAMTLWQEQFNAAENLEQLANPNSIYINNEDAFLEDSESDIDMANNRFHSARYAIQRAMSKVNNDIRFKNRFSEEYKKPVDEPVIGKGIDKDSTGDSGTSTVPYVNPDTVPIETPSAPVGNITSEMVAAENSDANKRIETQRSLDQSQQGQRKYYRPAVPELHIEASKEGDFRPFDVVVAEREPGVDFSGIYSYLRDNGAFSYVNAAKIKPGDTLGFMIDPDFNDHTIFLVDTRNNQIVGSIDESDASVARYEGLEEIIKKVRDEFSKRGEDATGKFFATPQTRVSKMMVGRVPYGTEDRSLADIPGVLDGDTKPVFGIIKNGALTTNEKIDDRLIIKPVDMAQKEGRLYLLIPNAAGTYSPAAVRVKHFNNREFNLDDATVANTPIGRSINEALDRLADAISQDDVSIAMKELAQDIYMQDVMVTWFDAKAGSGIVISRKIRKPDGTYEMVPINGQEQIREHKYTIYYQSSKKSVHEAAEEAGADSSIFRQPRDVAEIRRDILNTILGFNLPIQVSASRINDSGHNNRVIKSNVLTSNLREAKVIGSWFTTDYFDKQGNLQRSVSPSSVKPAPGRRTTTPVGGTEGVIPGTPVSIGGSTYTVDLKTMVYTDSKGAKYAATTSNANIFAMAWAQENFGDSTESSVMTENKVITPRGRVLDRNTGTYVSDAEAKRIKDKIAGKNQAVQAKLAQSKRVIADIYENQKKVDKARTDSNFYYVLEDDGQYHEYSRVHSRLGDNWLGERTETENSRRALKAGTAVDKVIRDFFTSKETPVKPETLSESAFTDLISKLTEIKSKMKQMGETFMADNIVLFQKYADGTRVAGEVDILSVDKDGNFKIYDVKTSRYSFGDRYFTEKSSKQRMSTKDYYTLQLSAYQNLFESQYGVRPTRLAILPFVLSYDEDRVASITGEKGILINYNPAVNVPLASAVQAPQQQESLPIFDSTMETMITKLEEQNRVLPENAFEEGGEIGYYEKEGKLYTGYLKKIGEVEVTYGSGQKDNVPIHVTKVRDRGFSRAGEFGSTSEYSVVFPNGYAVTVVKRSTSDNEAFKLIMDALSANPEKVLHLSNEKTQVYNPRMLEELDDEIRNTQYSPPQAPQPSGASEAVQKSDAINPHDEEFEDDLDLEGVLRRVDDISRKIWNQKKELAWLRRVLPQLSEHDRIKVVKGLIQVAENGPVAWGRFSDGIITLSDIAAEGTTYHEAFHAVFNLMLSPQEREALLKEARQLYGTDTNLEEEMAEGFREYVSSQETRGLGRRILDFFQNLFAKVTNWKYMKPSLINYYRMINQGKYAERNNRAVPNSGANTKEFIDNGDGTITLIKNSSEHDPELKKILDEINSPVLLKILSTKRFVDNGKWINKQVQQKASGQPLDSYFGRIKREHIEQAINAIEEAVSKGVTFDFLEAGNIYYDKSKGFQLFNMSTSPRFYGKDGSSSRGSAVEQFQRLISSKGIETETTGTPWSTLLLETRQALEAKGWTQEKFDSISQRERDQAVECLGL